MMLPAPPPRIPRARVFAILTSSWVQSCLALLRSVRAVLALPCFLFQHLSQILTLVGWGKQQNDSPVFLCFRGGGMGVEVGSVFQRPAPYLQPALHFLCRMPVLPHPCSLNSTCKGTSCESGSRGSNCSCQEGLVDLRWVWGPEPWDVAPGLPAWDREMGFSLSRPSLSSAPDDPAVLLELLRPLSLKQMPVRQ